MRVDCLLLAGEEWLLDFLLLLDIAGEEWLLDFLLLLDKHLATTHRQCCI